jgi:hypothetical protein
VLRACIRTAMKVSKYTAHQKLEHAELAMQRQDVDAARDCLRDAAELAPQVAVLQAGSRAVTPASRCPSTHTHILWVNMFL